MVNSVDHYVNQVDDIVNDVDYGHENVNDPPISRDIAPIIGAAGRAVIAAMMTRLSARGFDGMTPAFATLIPQLDAAGQRARVLAQRSGVSKQAMSKLLRELETRGYIEQAPDPTDTRAKLVRLTKRGAALRAACLEARHELQALASETLGQGKLARLQADLLSLIAAFSRPSD